MTVTLADHYELLSVVGQGTFATVWKGRDRLTYCPVAAKQFPKLSNPIDAVASFYSELEVLKDIDFPFIEQLYDVVETDDSFWLILEYVEGGSLLEFVNNHGPMPEHFARMIFIELVMAIEYLHQEREVAHRDIKAENVLLDRNNNIRLIDFGLSVVSTAVDPTSCVCGSSAYLSPELFMGIKKYAKESDVWSMGVVLFAICAGHLPFQEKNLDRLSVMVMNQEPCYPKFLSCHLTDLLHGMLTKDPEQRITLNGILHHPWVQCGCGTVNRNALMPLKSLYNVHVEHDMDAQILRAMELFGMDTGPLASDLRMRKMNAGTALYTSLMREKMTDVMASVKDRLLVINKRLHPQMARIGAGNRCARSSTVFGSDFRIPSEPQILGIAEGGRGGTGGRELSPLGHGVPLKMQRGQAGPFQSLPVISC